MNSELEILQQLVDLQGATIKHMTDAVVMANTQRNEMKNELEDVKRHRDNLLKLLRPTD